MEFRKFTAGKKAYGLNETDPNGANLENVNFYDPSLKQQLLQPDKTKEALVQTLLFLGICHTIVYDEKKDKYNAASPDELALVNFAKQQGMEFKGMDIDDNMVVKDTTGSLPKNLTFKLLHVCEFTSTRKRMSVIVKDNQKNQIVLMCKGADSIVRDLLDFSADDGTLSFTQ